MKRASHIPAPRAAACDDLHLRASAQHWHVSTFCVTGNSPEFPVITSENTLREFPLVIATVAKVSRKRGLWLVVRVKKGDTRRYLHFYSFSSAASYVGMIQIRYTGLGDTANFSLIRQAPRSVYFLFSDKIYYILSERKSQVCTRFRT